MFVVCSVCYESVGGSSDGSQFNNRLCAIKCGHIFHIGCINGWWRSCHENGVWAFPFSRIKQYSCPLCRSSNTAPMVFEVYCSASSERTEDDYKAEIVHLKDRLQKMEEERDRVMTGTHNLNRSLTRPIKVSASAKVVKRPKPKAENTVVIPGAFPAPISR